MRKRERECVREIESVRKRERVCVWEYVFVCERVCMCERECVCERGTHRACVSERQRERLRGGLVDDRVEPHGPPPDSGFRITTIFLS